MMPISSPDVHHGLIDDDAIFRHILIIILFHHFHDIFIPPSDRDIIDISITGYAIIFFHYTYISFRHIEPAFITPTPRRDDILPPFTMPLTRHHALLLTLPADAFIVAAACMLTTTMTATATSDARSADPRAYIFSAIIDTMPSDTLLMVSHEKELEDS
jgi:hypothetical protein